MSSSRAKFTQSELQRLNTWCGPENIGFQRSEPVKTEESPRTLTVEEIEEIQKRAHEEAFQQGRMEGFEIGKAEGFEEGKRLGLEAGNKQGYEENLHLLQKQATELLLLMESLGEPFQKLDNVVEQELVKLTIAIAEQIIYREIKLDPNLILEVIREAIKVLPMASQKITLTLHPEDAELVRIALMPEQGSPPWRLLENPLTSRGGCMVETEYSTIDATLENRLAGIVTTVLGGDRQQDIET